MENTNYLNLYTQFYDALNTHAPAQELAFYLEYARAAHGPILEPMCGSGRFLIPLHQAGFEIHGFDASAHMLESLHKKCTALSITPQVWFDFLQTMQRSERYALILIPSASFNLFLTTQDIMDSLQAIYEHLQPGGTLVIELMTLHEIKHALTDMWRGSMQKLNNGTMIVAHHLDLPIENNIGTTIMRYELVGNHTIIATEVEEFKVRFYENNEMDGYLAQVGFRNIKKIKAFDHAQQPDTEDEIIIYQCIK